MGRHSAWKQIKLEREESLIYSQYCVLKMRGNKLLLYIFPDLPAGAERHTVIPYMKLVSVRALEI